MDCTTHSSSIWCERVWPSAFWHTSSIYIELNNRSIFDRDVAQNLLSEMERTILAIEKQGVYANEVEQSLVVNVYRKGVAALQKRLRASRGG